MARKGEKPVENQAATSGSGLRGFWQDQIDAALRRHGEFRRTGGEVRRRYRLERENQRTYYQDKYNILYSTTETMKPSLYAQTPKVQASPRHRDNDDDNVVMATLVLENSTQYALEEIDFDHVLENVIEDYLLPGMGCAWVRYDPQITTVGEGDDQYDDLTFQGLALDYVNADDFITDDIAIWGDKRWVARRVYLFPSRAEGRFGKDKAKRLKYTHTPLESKHSDSPHKQAVVWEIWDREAREALWFSEDYPDELLDRKPDPLRLKDFFPCPRPVRAVHTTDTFIPTSFYSQYKAQAETLDDITFRIRILTKALRVVGVYDNSQEALAKILTGNDNKMVGVENWAAFATQGGMNGQVQFLPIKEVAAVLTELYRQREIAKNEIYEITGFSDIVRGVSKASETLGAQEIKNNWATGRLRSVQKEVQRFCRDIIRIMAEIIAEHFDDVSLALYSGFRPPEVSPEEQQAAAQYAAQAMQAQMAGQPMPPPPVTERQQAMDTFKQVVALLRAEKLRCANIGIETDSTILPDETQERKDRMEFLGQIGA